MPDPIGASHAARVQPSSADPATAGAANQANAPNQISSSSKIKSMEDLRKKYPEFYKLMLEGIAWHITGEMQRHQARLKELWRKAGRG
jgi:hypothetical protein